MLGLGRASQYAGWWSSGSPTADMTLTFTVDVPQVALASPRWIANYSGVDATQAGGWSAWRITVGNTSANRDMDQSGIGTEAKRQIHAFTVKVGNNWMTTAPTTGYTEGWTQYQRFTASGNDDFFGMGLFKNNNQYELGLTNGQTIAYTPAQFADLRDRWISIVGCTSNTSSDFSSWTGGTGSTFACRILAIDVETGSILNQKDGWSVAGEWPTGNTDLSQQYQFANGSATYNYDTFASSFDFTQYYRDEIQVGAGWFAIGQTVDPATYYTELTGFGIGPTVNSVQSWNYWYFTREGDSNGTPQDGWQQSVPTGSRLPTAANCVVIAQTYAGDSPIPTMVELN